MSGQPLNDVSLREHLEARIENIEKGISVAFLSMQDRLAGMNEFRDALKDQASKFVTDKEMRARIDALIEKINALELSKALLEGKASQSQVNITLFIAIGSFLLSLFTLLKGFFE